MMKMFLPGFPVDLIIPRFFIEAKGFVKECRRSRIDIEVVVSAILAWIFLKVG